MKHKQKTKKNKIGLIIIIALIASFLFFSSGSDTPETPNENDTTTSETVNEKTITYEDSNMKVEYKKIEKQSGIEGCLYLSLKIDNITDQTVTVMLKDVSINGNSMQTGTGMPITIHPDESSSQPFIIFQSGTDIDEAEDVEIIKFRVVFYDENYNEYKVSERITVEV